MFKLSWLEQLYVSHTHLRLSRIFLNDIIILGIWGYNKFSLYCIISIFLHKSSLPLQNALFLCVKFVNLLRPIVIPREHCKKIVVSKVELCILELKFLLITLNHGFLAKRLILMVGLLQIIFLVDVFFIIPLVSCMLRIELGSLLSRLLGLNRTMKVCVWSMGMLSTII